MFSLLPISNASVMSLRNDKGIYLMPDGRINIASLPENKIDYLAKLISELPEFN
jgi:aromatic-amino-acid transaminase